MQTRKWTQRTELDFRYSVCRSAMGQFGFKIARAVVTVVVMSLLNLPIGFEASLIGNASLHAPLVTVAVLFVQKPRLGIRHCIPL